MKKQSKPKETIIRDKSGVRCPTDKIVFLDIDGVLCTPKSHPAFDTRNGLIESWDLTAVQLIRRLCIDANAKIVVTSVWRLRVLNAEPDSRTQSSQQMRLEWEMMKCVAMWSVQNVGHLIVVRLSLRSFRKNYLVNTEGIQLVLEFVLKANNGVKSSAVGSNPTPSYKS